jgi:hypothetical protein
MHPYYVPAGSETVAGRDQDASVCVDGYIDASAGYVYTTTHGANVYSNGGGQIKMKTNYLKSDGSYNHKLAYINQVNTSVSYGTIAITSAQLQNADGSTVKFDKSSGTINYVDGVWTCAHEYAPYTVAPTCTEQGYTINTCACGANIKENYVDALGHDPVQHAGQDATCTEAGWAAYETCSRCDYTTYNEIDAIGHRYEGVVTTNPGCESEGVKTYTCSACGDSYTEAISATGHSYNAEVTAPTCTADGYTTYTCVCGHSYTDNTVTALGHSYDDGVVTTDPSCVAEGVKTYTCHCGDSYNEPVAALGHDMQVQPGQAPTVDVNGWTEHSACSRCDHKEGYEDLYYYNGLFVANGASYLNWEDALATGDTTIELLNDVTADAFELPVGITLDLSGKALSAATLPPSVTSSTLWAAAP